jgi:hypothetical protein
VNGIKKMWMNSSLERHTVSVDDKMALQHAEIGLNAFCCPHALTALGSVDGRNDDDGSIIGLRWH